MNESIIWVIVILIAVILLIKTIKNDLRLESLNKQFNQELAISKYFRDNPKKKYYVYKENKITQIAYNPKYVRPSKVITHKIKDIYDDYDKIPLGI